jgi:hypothetical protein
LSGRWYEEDGDWHMKPREKFLVKWNGIVARKLGLVT